MSDDFYSLFKKPDPRRPASSTVVPVDPGRASRYAATALKGECDTVATTPNGRRNHQLNTSAFNLAQLVAAGHLERAAAWVALRDAAHTCGLEDVEIDATLASGFKAGAETPRVVPDLPPVPDVTTLTAPGTPAAEISTLVRDRFPLLDWHELWAREQDDDEWIVEPILPARRLVALFSAPKVGKSILMLEIAAAIAAGTEILGTIPNRPRRVLYVDFENDPQGDILTRLQAMGRGPGDLDNLCYLSYPTLAKLDTAQGAAELMAVVAEYGCEVVVIDTISRAVGGEENVNDTWLAFYRNTGLALKQAQVACIRLDHTGKDHDKGMRGGSAKYGDVDAVWKLSRVTDDVYRLDCDDHRMRITETTIVVERQAHPLRHKVKGEGRMAAFNAKVTEIIAALDIAGLPDDAGRPGARAALKAVGLTTKDDMLNVAIRQRRNRFGYVPQEEL